MKICIYTNHFYPEDFKVNDIAFELKNRGYDVTVLTAIPDYPKGKYFDGYSLFKRRREIVNGVNVVRLPIIPRGRGGAKRLVLNYLSYYFCLTIFTLFHKFFHKYDKVFVHVTSPFYPAVCAKKLAKWQKIPLYVWVLDLWPESLMSAGGIKTPLIINPEVRRVKKVYDYANKILISSKGFEKSICEKGGYKDKLVYYPNWAEEIADVENSGLNIDELEPFCKFSKKDFIILFAGNIGESQNLHTVLEAAKILKKSANIKFVFLGDGRKKDSLVEFVNSNKLSETVFFPGRFPLSTMPLFMQKANVLLFSLKDELCFNLTVPAKVQFYMSQAKPVLAVINGEGASLIKEAKCGYAVNAGDTDSLVKTILDMEKMSKTALNTLGKNGKKFYQENFAKELRMTQLCEMLG